MVHSNTESDMFSYCVLQWSKWINIRVTWVIYCLCICLNNETRQRTAWGFFRFYFFLLLLSGVTVALPLSFLLPLVTKPLKHTNMEMDTVVTNVLSHNDTSKVAVRGGKGGAHRHKYCHRPIVSLLKEKQINSKHSNTLLLLPTYTVVELRTVMLWLVYGRGGGLCVKEKRGGERMVEVVPFLTSFLDRKYLLLAVHVQQQVGDTVAVAKLIVIPIERGTEKKR